MGLSQDMVGPSWPVSKMWTSSLLISHCCVLKRPILCERSRSSRWLKTPMCRVISMTTQLRRLRLKFITLHCVTKSSLHSVTTHCSELRLMWIVNYYNQQLCWSTSCVCVRVCVSDKTSAQIPPGQSGTMSNYSPRNRGKHHVLPRYLSGPIFIFEVKVQ